MKKVMFFLLVISLMASSCSDSEVYSGNREVTKIVKVRLPNGDLDWVRLNAVEMKVFKEGDTIRMSKTLHRINTDTPNVRVAIVSIIN